jgi:hypothetical protein
MSNGKIITPGKHRQQTAVQKIMQKAAMGQSLGGLEAQLLYAQVQVAGAQFTKLKQASRKAMEDYQERVAMEVQGLREVLAYGQEALNRQVDMLQRLVDALDDPHTEALRCYDNLIDEVRRYLAPRPEQEPDDGSPASS